MSPAPLGVLLMALPCLRSPLSAAELKSRAPVWFAQATRVERDLKADGKERAISKRFPRVYAVDGRSVDPFSEPASRTNVFVFVSVECPISNRYAPEIRRLCEKFGAQGIEFWVVYPNADEADQVRKHLKEFNYPCPGLRDPEHELVRASQVRVTPEVAVFCGARGLIYHGRIDNRFVDFGKMRPEATNRDLDDVLTALVQGKPVVYREKETRAVGCSIPE